MVGIGRPSRKFAPSIEKATLPARIRSIRTDETIDHNLQLVRQTQLPSRPSLANCVAAWSRRPGQLFRPGQPLSLTGSALHQLRNFDRHLWISRWRLQLDVCPVPVTHRCAPRQIRRSSCGTNQHCYLEYRVLRGCRKHRHRRFVRSQVVAGRR